MTYLYWGISLIWLGVFYAFMQSKKPKDEYETNDYWSDWTGDDNIWRPLYMLVCVLGILFWWVMIIVIFIIKLSNKYLFKK